MGCPLQSERKHNFIKDIRTLQGENFSPLEVKTGVFGGNMKGMKKGITALLFAGCILASGCNSLIQTEKVQITFQQKGETAIVVEVNRGEKIASLPTVVQINGSTITEWNIADDFIAESNVTISAISYTKGLEFDKYQYKNETYYEVDNYTGTYMEVDVPAYYKGFPVGRVGTEAFLDNRTITKVNLPEGLQAIKDRAFRNCVNMESFTIPSTVTEIGTYVFYQMGKVTKLELPEGITSIPNQAFQGMSLTELVIPEGVVSIGEHALTIGTLKTIVWPKSLVSVHGQAIWYPQQVIENIYYMGDESDWELLEISDDSYRDINARDQLSKIAVWFYSEEEPQFRGNYWHYVDGEPTTWEI